MMARRKTLTERVEEAQARADELEGRVVDLHAKEEDAVAVAVRAGTKTYTFGSVEKKAREDRLKAVGEREMLELELNALAVERAREIAEEANKALAVAIDDLSSHRPALENVFAEAGSHVAALAELWLKAKAEIEAFDSKVSDGRGLAAAAVTNTEGQAQWNAAVWALSDFGPLPSNVAYFVEMVLAAALDPGYADEYRINTMRAGVGIPDISGCNVAAHFSGDRHVKRGGSSFADSVGAVARRNEPKPPTPPPTAEQLANEAVAAAEQERIFQARQAREGQQRVYRDTPPGFRVAPIVDPDVTGDPSGLGLSDAEQRGLAELQTR